ncbi:MAG: hypothetical protein E7570_00345 [Ruminococcaceae bacterium]|nr:hypothetical protein [Oscillospiraceae bacterium]
MNLNASRRIISSILVITMAISTMVFLISIIMTFTTADQNFFVNQFASSELVAECNKQLNMKYEALSDETAIPARVFERVEDDFPTGEALRQAALSVFSEENETLYSENKISYFYELSTEYLDGNGISYNKADVKRAAEKAAKIYSDTVGLHNTGGVDERIAEFSRLFPRLTIISFIITFVCFPAVLFMYKKKKSGYFYAIGGLFTGTAATAVGSILLVVFNVGGGINILPEIHKQSIVSTSVKEFLILAFFSFVLSVAAFSVMNMVDRKLPDED